MAIHCGDKRGRRPGCEVSAVSFAADYSRTFPRDDAHFSARNLRFISEKTGSDCVVGVGSERLSSHVAGIFLRACDRVRIVAGPGTHHAGHELKAGRTASKNSRWRGARDHRHRAAVAGLHRHTSLLFV